MSDPTKQPTEGGKYVNEQGFWINGAGEYIDANGAVVEKPVKANQPKPDSRPAPTERATVPTRPTEK